MIKTRQTEGEQMLSFYLLAFSHFMQQQILIQFLYKCSSFYTIQYTNWCCILWYGLSWRIFRAFKVVREGPEILRRKRNVSY